jgi:hypothetical protein
MDLTDKDRRRQRYERRKQKSLKRSRNRKEKRNQTEPLDCLDNEAVEEYLSILNRVDPR